MSKLGSAPPPPPYKVPLSERIFGIGKLRPPVTDGAGGADLLSTIKLGSFSLELDGTGAWQMDSKLEQMYRAQITQLEAKVAQLEDERLNKNVYELEKRNIALERERLAVVDENNQLKFKNKVLMAMCTIAEGDYKALCKEAGIEPRSQKKPVPSPMGQQQALASPAAQSSQSQPQASPTSNTNYANPAASPAGQYRPAAQTGVPITSPGAGYAQSPYGQQQGPYSTTNQFSTQPSARNLQTGYQLTSAR